MRLKNETGKKYGKLTVIKRVVNRRTQAYWLCRCDCGNESEVAGRHLRLGNTKSCGHCTGRAMAYGYAALKSKYRNYQSKAKARNLIWQLDLFQFLHITQEKCHWCGSEPTQIISSPRGKYIFNGIDRVDNKLGYTLDNSVPCCGICNLMKREMTAEEWMTQMEKILNHQRDNK